MKKSREVINTWDRKYEVWFCAEAFHALLPSWEGQGARTIINMLQEDKIDVLCKVRAFVGFARGRIVLKHVKLATCRSSSWAFILPLCGMDGCRDAGMDGVGTGCYPDAGSWAWQSSCFPAAAAEGAFPKDSEVLGRPRLEMSTEEVYTGTV